MVIKREMSLDSVVFEEFSGGGGGGGGRGGGKGGGGGGEVCNICMFEREKE